MSGDQNDGIIIAPGQLIDLTLELYDNEGRLFNDDNDAVCIAEFVDKEALPAGSQIVNPEAVTTSGVVKFSQLNIR